MAVTLGQIVDACRMVPFGRLSVRSRLSCWVNTLPSWWLVAKLILNTPYGTDGQWKRLFGCHPPWGRKKLEAWAATDHKALHSSPWWTTH